jgi:alkylation response protein AidB-like acyl-CoA dehydrogenase
MNILDGGRISIASMALGIAQGAFDLALDYARQREQFNRPLFGFQGNQWKFAEYATEIHAARLLTFHAAQLKDDNKRVTTESAMAKLFAGDLAVKISSEAIQIFGGYGFSKEYPVERFFRDARLVTIGEGTSEIQKLVIARALAE